MPLLTLPNNKNNMDYPVTTADQLTHILKGARSQKNLSQKTIGNNIGLRQAAVSTVESAPGAVSLDRLLRVLSALELELVVRDIPAPGSLSKGEW